MLNDSDIDRLSALSELSSDEEVENPKTKAMNTDLRRRGDLPKYLAKIRLGAEAGDSPKFAQ